MGSDIHLKIGDIKGESTDDKHKDEIDVESWAWGASNTPSVVTGGGGGTGKPTFNDLSFVHRVDRATPSLWRACATGEHIRDATLSSSKLGKGPQDFFIIKMNDVMIASVALSETNGAGLVPMEQVTLKFARLDMEYKPQKPDGSFDTSVRFKFDIRTNKEG